MGDGPASVIFRDVCFSYDGERQILDQVSFQLPENGLISLVGTSGCGKEYHCRSAHRPESGLSRNDPDWWKGIVPDSEDSLLSHVTMVSHNSYLFKGTVRENLLMAAPMGDRKRDGGRTEKSKSV